MADPPAAVQICLECKKEGTLRCGECQSSFYCSKACQKANWPLHKILCKTFKHFQDRPAADGADCKYMRAIYFHPDEEVPRWIWLLVHRPWELTSDGLPDIPELYPEVGTLLANNDQEGDHPGRSIYFPDPYDLVPNKIVVGLYRDNFLLDGSKPNKAVFKVSDRRSRFMYDFRGPMLMYAVDTINSFRDEENQDYQDLNLVDLQIMAELFNIYRARNTHDLRDILANVTGVRINCFGDVPIRGAACEPFKVKGYDLVFAEPITPVSQRLELPIVAMRIPGSLEKWKKEPPANYVFSQSSTSEPLQPSPNLNMSSQFNARAAWLQIGFDPAAKPVGHEHWQTELGSVMVMRKDLKTLLPEHVHAISDYVLEYVEMVRSRNLSPEQGLKEISKGKFAKFWKEWSVKRGNTGLISPYDV